MYTFFLAVETEDDETSVGTTHETAMLDAQNLFHETWKPVKLRVCVEVDGEILRQADGTAVEFSTMLIQPGDDD